MVQISRLPFLMKSHQTRSTRDRSIPRSLKKVSFDEILDLTADVFSFYNKIPRGVFGSNHLDFDWDNFRSKERDASDR